MTDDWDSEDFVPQVPKGLVKESWEDEEEVKESWEDEDKPKKPAPSKPKKEEKKKEEPNLAVKEMTEEEKKKAQEEIDLVNATELFGISKSLDEISLNTREECIDYSNRLYAKLNKFHNLGTYQDFLEELFKSLCKNLPADTVRKISNSFKAFSDTKTAQEKAAKQAEQGIKGKGKVKPVIKSKKDDVKGHIDDFLKDNYSGAGYEDEYDEDNDFM